MPTPMAILSEVARPSGEGEGLAVWVSSGEELVSLPDEEVPDGLEVVLALEVGVLVVVERAVLGGAERGSVKGSPGAQVGVLVTRTLGFIS